MAETNIAMVFGEIFANIKVSSPARLISLYPGETVKLPKVLEEQASSISDSTDKRMVVNNLTLLKLGNSEIKGSWQAPSLTRQLKALKPGVVVLIP